MSSQGGLKTAEVDIKNASKMAVEASFRGFKG
jgi:hypothetical protein